MHLTFSSVSLFCFYVLHSKILCYVSLKLIFFSLKMLVKLTQYRGTIGVFNASIIMIKIKNRPISRLYYFRNTNQVSKNIYFFLVLLFSVSLYYFRQNPPKSRSSVLVYVFVHYTVQFSGCAS